MMNRRATIRLGAVTYLNTKPLVYHLPQFLPAASIRLDVPSRLADQLAADQLDVALVPIVELFARPDWRIISDACIASRGPVLSVKLIFRTAPERVRRVALDEGSRTSAALVRILLQQHLAIRPRFESLPMGWDPAESTADAVLVIGDRAIRDAERASQVVWDVGEVWTRWTGLPMVFAAWVARRSTGLTAVEAALGQSRDHGVRDLQQLARQFTGYQGLPYENCLAYLRDHLHFYLGEPERAGLDRFYQLACQMQLVPSGWRMQTYDCEAVG